MFSFPYFIATDFYYGGMTEQFCAKFSFSIFCDKQRAMSVKNSDNKIPFYWLFREYFAIFAPRIVSAGGFHRSADAIFVFHFLITNKIP